MKINRFSKLFKTIIAAILAATISLAFVTPVQALESATTKDDALNSFIKRVTNGDSQALRGVFVHNVMA